MRLEPLPNLTKNPLLAFNSDVLAELLGCSVATAKRYQDGKQRPRKGELAYLQAIVDRRIMPETWPRSMYFHRDKLVTPSDREPLTWAQVQQTQWVRNQWYTTVDFLGKIERGLQAISNRLTPDELARVKPIQTQIRQVVDVEHPLSPKARRRQWFRRDGC